MIREMPASAEDAQPGVRKWMDLARIRYRMAGPRELMHGWVADDLASPFIGTLPAFSYVLNVELQVTEAFNSNGSDLLSVGWSSDNDALIKATDVSITGIKTPTMGANDGYNSAEQRVHAYYVAGRSAATAGKALVIVEYAKVSEQIA